MSGHLVMAITSGVFAGGVLAAYAAGDYRHAALVGGVCLLGQTCGFALLEWLERKVGP